MECDTVLNFKIQRITKKPIGKTPAVFLFEVNFMNFPQ